MIQTFTTGWATYRLSYDLYPRGERRRREAGENLMGDNMSELAFRSSRDNLAPLILKAAAAASASAASSCSCPSCSCSSAAASSAG